jgi:hypothetical protein
MKTDLERPRFVLAILELAFLMRRKRRAASRYDRFSQVRSCAKCKNAVDAHPPSFIPPSAA